MVRLPTLGIYAPAGMSGANMRSPCRCCYRRYRHAFEPGCSIGMLTERLTERCEVVTATDVALAALRGADPAVASRRPA